MKRITDPKFIYKPSFATNISETIERERVRIAKEKRLQQRRNKEQHTEQVQQ